MISCVRNAFSGGRGTMTCFPSCRTAGLSDNFLHLVPSPLRLLDGLEQLLAQHFDLELGEAEFLPETVVIIQYS